MQISQGPHYLDDLLTLSVVTHRFDTGALTDADSVPSYRVYENETGTAILTGSMAKLDDANTTGFYSEEIALSAANGFEAGKTYSVYVSAAVNSVTGGASGSFTVSSRDLLGIIDIGTAQSATGTTLVLRSGAAFADDELVGATLVITGGSAGVGQRRIITDNVGTTDTVTVPTWTTTPTGTITYIIFASPPSEGVAQTGDAFVRLGTPAGVSVSEDVAALRARLSVTATKTGAVVDDVSNSATTFETDLTETADDHYKDCLLKFTSGDLAEQVKKITAYNGTTKFVTVEGGFTAEPAAADTFEIVND